ncbi:MAG: S26 family signal peptidase, partial [Alistipes sp.]|nr:S26 family signal peptidase [Alistipes sp.]
MNKIKNILKNRWVGFSLATILYVLWFVVWTGNLWMLFGVVFIFDAYITRYIYRFIGSKNEELCK